MNGLHSGFKLITGELLYGDDLRQPCSFAFAARETPAPECSEGERGGPHAARALENKGREHVGRRSTL